MDGYFDNTLDILTLICKRKLVVEETLASFEDNMKTKAPLIPCCLLETELDILKRYKDVLEGELFHNSNN